MEFYQAFPIAIIDEDYEGKNAAGRGMRQLAAAIEKQGFRVVAGLAYEDARRLVHIFNNRILLACFSGWRRRTTPPGGRCWRKSSPQSAAAMTACRFSCLA